jgi:exodeoxyribonuclease-3
MKIVSWNINGFRAITGQNPSRRFDKISHDNKLFDYLNIHQPDIFVMQEIKSDFEQIHEDLRTAPGYESYFNSCKIKKGYSGVAVFSKERPIEVRFGFGDSRFDDEGRILECIYDDFTLLNIYFPKGYTDHERLDYKMDFYDYLYSYLSKNKGREFIISGDYNTAFNENDLARPNENTNTSGFLKLERDKLAWMFDNGFIDTFRKFNEGNGFYTWWSQRGRARENNIGWRIDYHIVSSGLENSLKNSYHQPSIFGSDHCPIVLELK